MERSIVRLFNRRPSSFFLCMSHGKLPFSDGNALRVHETNQKPRAFELFSCVITLRSNVACEQALHLGDIVKSTRARVT